MDKETTQVIFRMFKGEVIALMPTILADLDGNVLSYMTIGQHGAATFDLVMAISLPASLSESKPLFDELTSIGYNLDVQTA